jgi:hypothetical protein
MIRDSQKPLRTKKGHAGYHCALPGVAPGTYENLPSVLRLTVPLVAAVSTVGTNAAVHDAAFLR